MAGGIIIPGDYDDWRWGGFGINPPGSASPAVLTEVSTDAWWYVFGNDNIMVFPDLQLPHDYKEGSDIVPHVHFASTTTATYTGFWTAVFNGHKSSASGTTAESATTVSASFNKTLTANVMESINFSAVLTGSDRKISSCITATLKLTLTAGAGLSLRGFDGHYLKDRLGSKQITTK